ncbi:hypothetical protein ACOSQ3_019667 [Xanthoceras sorbifolium]
MPPRRRQDVHPLVDGMEELCQQIAQLQQQLAALQAINQPPLARIEESDPDVEDEINEENPFAPLQAAPPHRRVPNASPPEGRPAAADNRRWKSCFKLDILEFHGSLEPEEFLDWIGAVEEILEFKEVPDNKRGSLVATCFRGRAAAWWQQLKVSCSRGGKEKIASWEKLKNT